MGMAHSFTYHLSSIQQGTTHSQDPILPGSEDPTLPSSVQTGSVISAWLSLGHHNLSSPNLDSSFSPPNCSPCSAQGPVNHTVPVAQTWLIFHAALFLPVPGPTHHHAPERLPREYLSSLSTSLFLPHCHPHHHRCTVLLPPPYLMYTPSPPPHVSSPPKPPSLHPPAHHPTQHPSPPPSPALHPAAHQSKLPLLFIRFSGLVSKSSNLTHSCPLLIQLDL